MYINYLNCIKLNKPKTTCLNFDFMYQHFPKNYSNDDYLHLEKKVIVWKIEV